MALSKRPKAKEKEVKKLIEKGGSEGQEERRPPPIRNVRFHDRDLYERMQAAVKSIPGKMSMNQWLLQAVFEKLERDARKKNE